MRTSQIINEIKKLPVHKRKIVIKEVISSIFDDPNQMELSQAAETMSEEYNSHQELSAFRDIDFDDFYEAR